MAAKAFKDYLIANQIDDVDPVEMDRSTHTAQEAAEVNNVKVSNIVKSLFLVSDVDEIVVLVPGDRRLEIRSLSEKLGIDYSMANADIVKQHTGYSIGGVPPFGHKQRYCTYVINGFDKNGELVAAAGSANTVFRITYKRLMELCDAVELDI